MITRILTGIFIIFSFLLFTITPYSLILTVPAIVGWLDGLEKVKKKGDISTDTDVPRCQQCGAELETEQEIQSGYCFNCEIENEGIATINQP